MLVSGQSAMSSVVAKKRKLDTITALTEGGLSPVRNSTDLFAVAETVRCAQQHGCIPCAYKIATFDVALDNEICQKIPNQRPELCPRSQLKTLTSKKSDGELPLGYKHGMSILTVGDGAFSSHLFHHCLSFRVVQVRRFQSFGFFAFGSVGGFRLGHVDG